MLIKRNEIDICINRSENTKGVRSFQVPRFAASKEIHLAVSMAFGDPLCTLTPPPPPPLSPPLHWSLLYVIEIETSIKTCLLLGTKES